MTTSSAPNILTRLRQYTGRPLSELHAQVFQYLETIEDATAQEIAASLDLPEGKIIAACQFLNESNLCWWSESTPPKYYLTAEGKCMAEVKAPS